MNSCRLWSHTRQGKWLREIGVSVSTTKRRDTIAMRKRSSVSHKSIRIKSARWRHWTIQKKHRRSADCARNSVAARYSRRCQKTFTFLRLRPIGTSTERWTKSSESIHSLAKKRRWRGTSPTALSIKSRRRFLVDLVTIKLQEVVISVMTECLGRISLANKTATRPSWWTTPTLTSGSPSEPMTCYLPWARASSGSVRTPIRGKWVCWLIWSGWSLTMEVA